MEDLGHVYIHVRDGQPLRILQLTDLHHFPLETHTFHQLDKAKSIRIPPQADNTAAGLQLHSLVPYSTTKDAALINQLLGDLTERGTAPDLVVLTGDIIDGRPFGSGGATLAGATKELMGGAWRQAMLEVIAPINQRAIPWTFVPGNHDDDHSPWSREDLLGIYQLPGAY